MALQWPKKLFLENPGKTTKVMPRSARASLLALKNGNFKTRDFSPLIKRVLAGVHLVDLSAL